MIPTSTRIYLGCIAGAISVLVFRQSTLQLLFWLGLAPPAAFRVAAVRRAHRCQQHLLGCGLWWHIRGVRFPLAAAARGEGVAGRPFCHAHELVRCSSAGGTPGGVLLAGVAVAPIRRRLLHVGHWRHHDPAASSSARAYRWPLCLGSPTPCDLTPAPAARA